MLNPTLNLKQNLELCTNTTQEENPTLIPKPIFLTPSQTLTKPLSTPKLNPQPCTKTQRKSDTVKDRMMYDDVTYVYDDVTYVYDDVTYAIHSARATLSRTV